MLYVQAHLECGAAVVVNGGTVALVVDPSLPPLERAALIHTILALPSVKPAGKVEVIRVQYELPRQPSWRG